MSRTLEANEASEFMRNRLTELEQRIATLEAALEEARKALERYGIHKQPCAQIQRRPPGEALGGCTCGLDVAHERIGWLMPKAIEARPTCDGTPLPDGRPRCGFVTCSCHGGD